MIGTLSLNVKGKSTLFTGRNYEDQVGNRTRHLACDRCRSAKVRCDGDRPKCERCATLLKGCSYAMTRKPRQSQGVNGEKASRDFIAFEAPSTAVPQPVPQPVSVSNSTPASSALSTATTLTGDFDQSMGTSSIDQTSWSPFDLSSDFVNMRDDLSLDTNLSPIALPGSESGSADMNEGSQMLEMSLPFTRQVTEGLNLSATASPRAKRRPQSSNTISSSTSASSWRNITVDGTGGMSINANDFGQTGRLSTFNPEPCNCLQQLTSNLFELNNLAKPAVDYTVSSVELETFLSLFKSLMEKWDIVRSCPSACLTRREYAILLAMNIEQLAKLHEELVRSITHRDEDDDTRRCSRSSNINQDDVRSSTPRSMTTRGLESAATSINSKSAQARFAVSVGRFVVDDASDEAIIVMQLLVAKMNRLVAFIKALRPRLMRVGFDECCVKLDEVVASMETLARYVTIGNW